MFSGGAGYMGRPPDRGENRPERQGWAIEAARDKGGPGRDNGRPGRQERAEYEV
jgi:hypothetical protein